ncbi:MAG: hypothetical protein JW774_11390 [Candidatus Aureabacteria bacterium]|nr:hypothetical protein [Candidatus Auribacterota bacterium]
MNVLFVGQGLTFRMFYSLRRHLSRYVQLEKTVFYISDSACYAEWCRDNPEMESFPVL